MTVKLVPINSSLITDELRDWIEEASRFDDDCASCKMEKAGAVLAGAVVAAWDSLAVGLWDDDAEALMSAASAVSQISGLTSEESAAIRRLQTSLAIGALTE